MGSTSGPGVAQDGPCAVQVTFGDFLARLAGCKETTLQLEQALPFEEFLLHLARVFGPELAKAMLDKNHDLNGEIMVVLNKQVVPKGKLKTSRIHQGSQVKFLVTSSGG